MERYIVLDSTGNKVGIPFKEWKEASIYKTIYGRQDWKVQYHILFLLSILRNN